MRYQKLPDLMSLLYIISYFHYHALVHGTTKLTTPFRWPFTFVNCIKLQLFVYAPKFVAMENKRKESEFVSIKYAEMNITKA